MEHGERNVLKSSRMSLKMDSTIRICSCCLSDKNQKSQPQQPSPPLSDPISTDRSRVMHNNWQLVWYGLLLSSLWSTRAPICPLPISDSSKIVPTQWVSCINIVSPQMYIAFVVTYVPIYCSILYWQGHPFINLYWFLLHISITNTYSSIFSLIFSKT